VDKQNMDLIINVFQTKNMAPSDRNKQLLSSQEIPHHLNSIEDMEQNEQYEEFMHNYITPPATPPSPPGPPPPYSPLWNQDDFEFHINKIQTQIDELEHKVMGPHIITINEIQNLRPHVLQNWKPKLNRLLFEAKIPFFWILDCVPHPDENREIIGSSANDEGFVDNIHQPTRILIYLLNHHVQMKIFNVLNTYLSMEYNNITYLN
jgi:hypothetical protein